ncbi:carbohydrate ABC transporter permease [Glycomyces algeriensis]|uniref:Sugar ABC transporter permease n=1 Tax=Glycomyces algeriensis TaxID=256037 RepID=A0A9W6LIZ4_9ACTN|nr:carbohydrate ABC transporter permease [Glycomyces algeriensis]MDA1368292.1 carbohydrate ABC transporter permease [Glycomyces algeriensis]MDR7351733.1 alpha-1,4-digalacturonate transport system permease protein [Glycomyces algeriensis]GLI44459.1 sugar ABC transporter permease [Glycomyces algeriensis]
MSTTTAPQKPVRKARKAKELGTVVPVTTFMWLLAALYAFPLVWFLLSAFKPGSELFQYPLTILPENPTIAGFEKAWDRFDFMLYFSNTLAVALTTTVLTVFASAMCGYALAKYQDKVWIRIFFVCLLATTMLPTEVILSPTFLVIRDLGMYDSMAGLVVPSILTATGVFMFRQFFVSIPDDIIEAARIDGARETGIFFRIMLPMSRPIIMTLAIFSFQWRWNDYIWPLIVVGDERKFTLQIALRSIVGAENIDWPLLLAASVMSILPLVLIFIVFQKYVMNEDINAGLKD